MPLPLIYSYDIELNNPQNEIFTNKIISLCNYDYLLVKENKIVKQNK